MGFIDYIFPRQCINCKQTGEYLCKECKRTIAPHPEICPYCHRYSQDYQTCFDCKTEKNTYLEGIIIPFKYSSLIKKLILKLKYQHKKDVTKFLIERIDLALQTNQTLQHKFRIHNSQFIISYVPSHWYRKYFVKGYNQSELLAKFLAGQEGFTFVHLLKKTKHTKSQAKLDKRGRAKNLKSAFMINNMLQIKGDETILLIDDVTTTGSTLNQTAKVIKSTYPKCKIRGIVIARHHG